jgi:multiple sugar transport system permease protein
MNSRMGKYLMVAPLVLLLGVVILVPFADSVYMAFTNATLFNISQRGPLGLPLAGLDQFQGMLSDQFLTGAVITTVQFAVASIALEMIIGTSLAYLLNHNIRGGRLFTTAMIIPILAPPVTVGLIWRFMLDSNLGIVNYALSFFGVGPFAFLADKDLALPSLIVVDTWLATPFVFLVMLAGFRSLPVEQMEAAKLDGANAWQTLIHVSLPMLRPVIGVVLLIRIIDSLRVFDIIYTLTGGGPGTATTTLMPYVYRVTFESMNIGYASAIVVMFVIVLGFFSLGYLRSFASAEA